jgi:hypothetical protein
MAGRNPSGVSRPRIRTLRGDTTVHEPDYFRRILPQMVPERTLTAGKAGSSDLPAGTDGFSGGTR